MTQVQLRKKFMDLLTDAKELGAVEEKELLEFLQDDGEEFLNTIADRLEELEDEHVEDEDVEEEDDEESDA